LAFLDRRAELERISTALDRPGTAFVCLYGRRRLGKSRLLLEALKGRRAVYYVGDDRDAPLQRTAVAGEMARVVPGFADVAYPGWAELLERWWREAPRGAVLALDELPAVVRASPELPSLLQKLIDRPGARDRKLMICGSSQEMMLGLVLDATAPLYGRAHEILRIGPLPAGWLPQALAIRRPAHAIESWAVWGGVPRYWELARTHRARREAVRRLVLEPLGVLHDEPERLLLDDMTEPARAASILTLIAAGCHRASEIAARIGLPVTTLSRPLSRLLDLGLVMREVPFGRSTRDTKRTFYRIADPFLRFWYRFVEPNRSQLGAGHVAAVSAAIEGAWRSFLGGAWEELARASVPALRIGGRRFGPASRWWGRAIGGQPLELDLVAEGQEDRSEVLVGEAKLACPLRDVPGLVDRVAAKAAACPALRGRRVRVALWVLEPHRRRPVRHLVGSADVLRALR
jgi:AAA+ ATPase superfamily predicted ATPase